jgi:predicted Zn-dependent peptidase
MIGDHHQGTRPEEESAMRLPIAVLALLLVLSIPAGLSVVAAQPAPPADTADAKGAAAIKEIKLDNGLRIFVLERPATPTFAALYKFGAGGVTDPKGRSGIAHLLEHMMFKGTTSLGTLNAETEANLIARLDGLWEKLYVEMAKEENPFQQADREKIEAIEKEIEAVSLEQKELIVKNEYDELMTRAGAVGLNASTGNDSTQYIVQLPSNRLEFWFRMESGRLMNPVFREFYSERDVVLEERRQRVDNTARGLAREAMQSLLFTAHPYGMPVIGWPRDLQRLMRQDAMDYFTTKKNARFSPKPVRPCACMRSSTRFVLVMPRVI